MTLQARHSRLYRGLVVHTRLRPRRHRLRKRIPMLLCDLDELPGLKLPLLAVDRFGPLSIDARHHLSGARTSLKAQVKAQLAAAGVEADGAIRLLCMPAVFGKVFNPLSVYFCHGRDGELAAMLYEVNNTFGGRHCYVLPTSGGDEVRHGCAKTFHVSPFMDMDLSYAFRITPPGQRVSLGITVSDGAGVVLSAAFAGEAEPLTNRALLGVLLRHPLLMFEVLGAIHWEAVKMLAKGLRLAPNPGAAAIRPPRPKAPPAQPADSAAAIRST